MTTRIILHPGFHKTGTSSLQRGALARAAELDRHLRLFLKDDLFEATDHSRRYSRHGGADTLRAFRHSLSSALAHADTTDPRPILISSEDLSGHLPGKPRIVDYGAAPVLMGEATAALRDVFGSTSDIDVVFTPRAADPWLRSAYWQILRGTRYSRDFDTFARKYRSAADFHRVISQTQKRVGKEVTVHNLPLEACIDDPLGPLGWVLKTLKIPTGRIAPLPAQNVQPEGAAEEFLALNRSDIDDHTLAETKRRVYKSYRLKGATRR